MRSMMLRDETGLPKLGQPVPESNLEVASKRATPQAAQW